jgi:hypothetical protein
MGTQGTKLQNNPQAMQAFNRAVEGAKSQTQETKPSIKEMRNLLASPEISSAMMDILQASSLSKPQRIFLEEVFIKRKTRKIAISKAFGRDLGYQEDAVAVGILNHPEVKDFLDMIKLFYIQVAPIAALKEVEIMIDERTSTSDALKAAKQISDKAGLATEEGEGKHLPVNIQINIPAQNQTPEPKTIIDMPDKGG